MKFIALVFLSVVTVTSSGNEELIFNGDFEKGNAGFKTDYGFVEDGTGQPGTGVYGITTDPSLWHNLFESFADHGPGAGNMMVVNASSQANRIVWVQTVDVLPNSIYKFSLCAASISPSVTIALVANDDLLSLTPLTLGDGQWGTIAVTWESVKNQQMTIEVFDANTQSSGNDFALDNISLSIFSTGDINGDCEVNLLDIQPFVDLISNGEFQLEADVNQDGDVDLLDIQPFVNLLIE